MGIQHIMSDDEMLKDDDILIWRKGIKSLSDYELEQACRCRGYLGLLSKKQMLLKLQGWLDLSLNHAVPISLLILSRPFAVSDKVSCVEALRGAISSLPDSVVSTLGTVLPSDSERRRKLEFLEMKEALIKEEERGRSLAAQKAKEHSVSKEREELLSLVNKEIEGYNLMLGKKGPARSVHEAKEAYKKARGALGYKPLSELAEKVDCLLEELEKEIDDLDAIIGSQEQLHDKDRDGKVTSEKLAAAAVYFKENLDKEGVQEIIANLSKDKNGKVLVEDIVKLGSKQQDAINSQNG
ncbi:uncharacterized protein LOC144575445 [Carex rostrata]